MTMLVACRLLPMVLIAASVCRAPQRVHAQESVVRAQFDEIVGEYDKAQQEFFKAYQAAGTDKDRETVGATYPSPQAYAPRLLRLAKEHPNDSVAEDALVWVVTRARFGKECDEATEILLEDHIQSEKLGPICLSLVYSGSQSAGNILQSLRDKNPHREVKGQASYALAILKNQRQESGEAEKLFEDVVASYGDIDVYGRTLGDLAKSELFELHNLAVGKPAPEIQGQDVDGREFLLSEYRGKVVVLDFWGDW